MKLERTQYFAIGLLVGVLLYLKGLWGLVAGFFALLGCSSDWRTESLKDLDEGSRDFDQSLMEIEDLSQQEAKEGSIKATQELNEWLDK